MIINYQSRILSPDEVIDYSAEMINAFPPDQLYQEPMVGFKVLCKDLNAYSMKQSDRFMMLEQNLAFLRNSGCVIRESHLNEAPDGFWVITFPVPQFQLMRQLNSLMQVLAFLSNQFGIVSTDVCEINVSGRCGFAETEIRLANICIPNQFGYALVEPQNTPYKMGHVLRINEDFILLRTMWDFSKNKTNVGHVANRYNELTIIPQLLMNAFH